MDLMNQGVRKALIDEIEGTENKERRAESLKQVEIFNDRLEQYVHERLREQYTEKTVKEMPIISSINLSRRIVKQEASVYKSAPERNFSELSEDQEEAIAALYNDMSFDAKMKKANESFKLQNQVHAMILPKNGKLCLRILRNHHVDVVPDPEDPEEGLIYIISGFDKQFFLDDFSDQESATGFRGDSEQAFLDGSDKRNQKIGDADDYQSVLKRYVFWSKDYNFMTDERGTLLTPEEDVFNPLAEYGCVPIFEVSIEKDFEYWVRQGKTVTDFTIDYNVAMTSLGQIVHMQGFAQAVLIGDENIMPENIQIGPNHILRLPISGAGERPDFKFVTPSPDVAGSIAYVETLLANFLSSRGIDPGTISGKLEASTSSSGIQELLKMIKQFGATKDDFASFEYAEHKAYKIIKAWHGLLSGTDQLDPKYSSPELPQDSDISVVFAEPQMIMSEQERLNAWEKKIDLGIASRVDAIADFFNMDRDDAVEMAQRIDQEQIGDIVQEQPNITQEEDANQQE